jgi:hypothetical protein
LIFGKIWKFEKFEIQEKFEIWKKLKLKKIWNSKKFNFRKNLIFGKISKFGKIRNFEKIRNRLKNMGSGATCVENGWNHVKKWCNTLIFDMGDFKGW